MTPITFKEANITYAKNQKEYIPLPAHRTETDEHTVTSCWKLSFKEAVRLLFTRKIWHGQMTFGNALQPTLLTTKKEDLLR